MSNPKVPAKLHLTISTEAVEMLTYITSYEMRSKKNMIEYLIAQRYKDITRTRVKLPTKEPPHGNQKRVAV